MPPSALAKITPQLISSPPETFIPIQTGPFANYAVFDDISLETPDNQFQRLSNMLSADDAAKPAPFTSTTAFGEWIEPSEVVPELVLDEAYLIPPDVEAAANTELLSVTTDAPTNDIPEWTWENDDQYHGLGVPPGVQNLADPIEYGRTQAVPEVPSAVHGWDAWSGRPPGGISRVARHENMFKGYSADTNRRLGEVAVEKMYFPYYLYTQQQRDLMLAELNRRGVHNVVVADIPQLPYTEQVLITDPAAYAPEPVIGPEGVLP